MKHTIELLKEKNLIKIIDTPLDIKLEIPHVAYIEAKKENPKALLFTAPKEGEKSFNTPVFMNIFGSFPLNELLVGDANKIAKAIESLLKMQPPKTLGEKIKKALELYRYKSVFPKILKEPLGTTHTLYNKNSPLLDMLPILTTWEEDGGAFITMGQVYAQSLDGNIKNVGMYRLQKYDKASLGLHWQIHKDSRHFFDEYKKAGKKMPISIALGGDPLYTWCATAPMPYGVFELMLYGFIRGVPPRLVKSSTNPIYIPQDADIVIEGFVDPTRLKDEGRFGDHTGYYTPIEPYPVLEVESVAIKKEAVYPATVVGKPPLEDKYMGYLTERIFLPLLQTTAPSLLDYHMPENGVFHNLIIAKTRTSYPGEAKQVMHSLWGAGQMSFVKHAIFVDDKAPALTDYKNLCKYILERFSVKNLIISEGVCDALDHASPEYAYGGKAALDCTKEAEDRELLRLNDEELLSKLKELSEDFKALRQFETSSKNPITVILLDKKERGQNYVEKLKELGKHLRIVALLDCKNNDLNYPYMLLWRVVNNIDAKRDMSVYQGTLFIDATAKTEADGHPREWPKDVLCTQSVLDKLKELGVIELSDEELRRFGLVEFEGC